MLEYRSLNYAKREDIASGYSVDPVMTNDGRRGEVMWVGEIPELPGDDEGQIRRLLVSNSTTKLVNTMVLAKQVANGCSTVAVAIAPSFYRPSCCVSKVLPVRT